MKERKSLVPYTYGQILNARREDKPGQSNVRTRERSRGQRRQQKNQRWLGRWRGTIEDREYGMFCASSFEGKYIKIRNRKAEHCL